MKRPVMMLTAIVAVFLLATPAYAAGARNGIVFNSVPTTLPGNVPSVGFQANQASELGDGIRFTPSRKKHLKNVTVVMSSWACQTGDWTSPTCATTVGATFMQPITLNLYAADTAGVPGALIHSDTEIFPIKYRPSADPTDCGAGATTWYSVADNQCYNGKTQRIVFNLAALHLILPNSIVYGIAFNTSGYGATPYGYATSCAMAGNCPYDSLNVAVAAGLPQRGADRYVDGIFWNTQTAGNYCDGGGAGTGTFRLDDAFGSCNWTGYNPLVKFHFE